MSNPLRNFDAYSPFKLKVLRWMYAPAAILSAISSACLLRLILFADVPNRQQKTYHRLLFGISVIDIIASLALAVFPPLIYEPNLQPGPLCTTDAVFQVFGGGAPIYAACLSVYFLLVIRYSVPDKKIVARYEIWFHLISVLYPFFVITWALIDGAFNPYESNLGCYIEEYPIGCVEDGSCKRGSSASWIGLVGAIIPFFTILFTLVFTNVLIYLKVRKIEDGLRKYDFSHNTNTEPADTRTNDISSSRGSSRPSKSKRVAAQSFLFVLGFFLTYMTSLALYIVGAFDSKGLREGRYFALQVLAGATFPLQGFFDFLVYLRPRYLQCRRHHENEWSRGKCFIMAAFSLQNVRNKSKSNNTSSKSNNNTQDVGQNSLIGDIPKRLESEVSNEGDSSSDCGDNLSDSNIRDLEAQEQEQKQSYIPSMPSERVSLDDEREKSVLAVSEDDDLDDEVQRHSYRRSSVGMPGRVSIHEIKKSAVSEDDGLNNEVQRHSYRRSSVGMLGKQSSMPSERISLPESENSVQDDDSGNEVHRLSYRKSSVGMPGKSSRPKIYEPK